MKRRRGYWPTSDPIQIEQKPNPTLLLQFAWSLLSISWFPLMSSSSCMFCCCRRCNSSTTTTYRRPSVRFCRLPSTCSLLKIRPISLSLSLVCLFTKEERQIVDKRKDLDRERERERETQYITCIGLVREAGRFFKRRICLDFLFFRFFFFIYFHDFYSIGEFKRKTLNHCPLLLKLGLRENLQRFISTLQIYS